MKTRFWLAFMLVLALLLSACVAPIVPATGGQQASTQLPPMAKEYAVWYALPDTGIAYMLTPRRELPKPPDIYVETPSKLAKELLGTLTVTQSMSSVFEPDIYNIALDADAAKVQFIGSKSNVKEFPAVIRKLSIPLTTEKRPIALIGSYQMCLTWDVFQVCALVSTPLPQYLRDKLEVAIKELGAAPENFQLDAAIPDVEGSDAVETCKKVLSESPSRYHDCKATVLSAPAKDVNSLPSLKDVEKITGTVTGTGVLVVLSDLKEDVFQDVRLSKNATGLPKGNYLMYDIEFSDDSIIKTTGEQQIKVSRARLWSATEKEELYMPAVVSVSLVGQPKNGKEPTQTDQVSQDFISNLWRQRKDGHWTCYFKKWQCPYLDP